MGLSVHQRAAELLGSVWQGIMQVARERGGHIGYLPARSDVEPHIGMRQDKPGRRAFGAYTERVHLAALPRAER